MTQMRYARHRVAMSLLLGLFLCISSPSVAQPPDRHYSTFKPCRRHVGFSRCVEPPLNMKEDALRCPYHVCGPSFVKAKKCGKKGRKATHYCKRHTYSERNYECIKGKKHRRVKLPIGCKRRKGECISSTRTCLCRKVGTDHEVYVKLRRARFLCNHPK